jgi:hypothetical protein
VDYFRRPGLSTPHPAAFVKSLWTSRQGLRSWYVGLVRLPALPELMAGRTLAKSLRDSGLPPEFVDRYTAALAEPGALTGALNWYRGIPFSSAPRWGGSNCPPVMSGGGMTSLWPDAASS